MKAVKIAANKSGTRYAVVRESEVRHGGSADKFSVWIEKSNYSRTAHGGITKTWRSCARNMDASAADVLFNRRLAGTLR